MIQRLAKEIRQLQLSPPDGVTLLPTEEESLVEVHVEMAGPEGTPYAGEVRGREG